MGDAAYHGLQTDDRDTPLCESLEFQPPVWRRWTAAYIDVITLVPYYAILDWSQAAPWIRSGGMTYVLFVAVVPSLVWAWQESGERVATIGKRLVKLQVRPLADGGRLSHGRSLMRNLFKFSPWILSALAGPSTGSDSLTVLGYMLLILVTAILLSYFPLTMIGPRRALHDRLVGSVVEWHPEAP